VAAAMDRSEARSDRLVGSPIQVEWPEKGGSGFPLLEGKGAGGRGGEFWLEEYSELL